MALEQSIDEIVAECLKHIKADTARISKPFETMYLIIGFNRNTAENKGSFWTDPNGKRIDFDYIEEHIIASGRTPEELYKSVKEYQRLLGLSIEDYLQEKLRTS